MASRPSGDGKVAACWVFIFVYVVLAVRAMATGRMHPPPRLDRAFAFVILGVFYAYICGSAGPCSESSGGS